MHIILLSAPPLTPRKSKKSLDYPQRDSLSSSSALQPAPLGTSVLLILGLILGKMSQSMLILPGAISIQASNPGLNLLSGPENASPGGTFESFPPAERQVS